MPWPKARPVSEDAAMERREAPVSSQRGRGNTKEGSAARCSIPSAFEGTKKCPAKAGKDDGLPRAAKNTGDDACLSLPPKREG